MHKIFAVCLLPYSGRRIFVDENISNSAALIRILSRKAAINERRNYIVICDNVWFGGDVKVTGGVTIGENSVIGAGSVVTHDIPANCIAAGVPCKVIRTV